MHHHAVLRVDGLHGIELANLADLAAPAGGQARPSTAEEIALSIAEAITSAMK